MAAIDNLNSAERLGFIADADTWLRMRRPRNRLVYEYFEASDELIPAIKQVATFTDELASAANKMTGYAIRDIEARRDALS
jgi:hypothetical protein